eukprot:GDKJ01025787.1.p1 GENE.GDKJ01025787.1~~GDKJ01025787.1.p1  ORF type:complete len:431 (+),score=126.70 GDKJ01025787.1:32-1324(+)
MNIEDLLIEEKQKRLAQDSLATSKLCCDILTVFKTKGDWDALVEHMNLLIKKRGQLKTAIVDMVDLVIRWMEETTDKKLKLRLIKDLCDVTEGKMLVEVERARVVRTEARILESEGKFEEAAKLLQEVQVETFGSMDKRERAEYILDQMRVVLQVNDWIRCHIVSKKLSSKVYNEEGFEDIKVKYFEYMAKYWEHEQDRLELAKCFAEILDVKPENLPKHVNREVVFTSYVLSLLLSVRSEEQQKRIKDLTVNDKYKIMADSIEWIKNLLYVYNGEEILTWPLLEDSYPESAAALKNHPLFDESVTALPPSGDERFKTLEQRVVEHNIRLMSKGFSSIKISRFAELLGLEKSRAEKSLAAMVSDKHITALIDRPAGVIKFGAVKSSTELLDQWTGDVDSILGIVEEIGHLLQKERVLAAVKKATSKDLQN